MRSNPISLVPPTSPCAQNLSEPIPTRCPVCGFEEVPIDLAIDRGLVSLAECPRCEHRWTQAGWPLVRIEFEPEPLDVLREAS